MRLLVIFLSVLCLLSPAALHAQTKEEKAKAAQSFKEGDAYYKLREFEKAIESYKASYIIVAKPDLLFNIAQCYRMLERDEDALKTYQTFIKEAPKSPQRKKADKLIAQLEEKIKNKEATPATQPVTKENTPPITPSTQPTSPAVTPKETPKENPPKETPKETPKEAPKTQIEPTKETPKDPIKETPKEAIKPEPASKPAEPPKEIFKETPKEATPKETPKNPIEPPKETPVIKENTVVVKPIIKAPVEDPKTPTTAPTKPIENPIENPTSQPIQNNTINTPNPTSNESKTPDKKTTSYYVSRAGNGLFLAGFASGAVAAGLLTRTFTQPDAENAEELLAEKQNLKNLKLAALITDGILVAAVTVKVGAALLKRSETKPQASLLVSPSSLSVKVGW